MYFDPLRDPRYEPLQPTPEEIDAWASRERKRREAWLAGPTRTSKTTGRGATGAVRRWASPSRASVRPGRRRAVGGARTQAPTGLARRTQRGRKA